MQSPLEAVRNERQWHQWVLNHWALAATFGQFISLRFFWLDARDRLCPRAVHGNRENRECNSMEQPETFMQQRVSGNECHQGLSYVFPQFHECHVIAMWLLYRLPVYKECHGTMAQEEVNLLLCGCVWQTRLVALCWLRQRIRRHLSESCNMPTSVVASDSLHPSEFVRIRPNPSLQVLQRPFDHLICGPTEIDWGCHLEGEKNRHRLSKLNGLALPQFRARWPWHITCNQMFIIFYIILLWSSYSSWNAAVSRSLMGAECARANELVQCPVWKRSKRMQWPLFQHQAQESGEASYLEIRIITIVFFEYVSCVFVIVPLYFYA